MNQLRIMAAICMAAFGLPLSAQTLSQAWQQAEAVSHVLQAQQAEQQAAAASTRAARAAAGISLNVGAQWQQRDHAPRARADLAALRQALGPLGAALPAELQADIDDDHGGAFDAELRYPLYSGGKLDALLQAALSAEQLAAASGERSRQALRLSVADAFYNELRSAALLAVTQQQLDSLQSLRRDVAAMFRQGVLARADVLGAEVAVADAMQKQLAAVHAHALAQAAYNRLQGVPFDTVVAAEAGPLPATLEAEAELLARALQQRPELAALRAGRSGLQQQALISASDGKPQLAAFARYQYSQNPLLVRPAGTAVGVGMHWQLFDSGLVRARAAADSARADAVTENLAEVQSLIALEIRHARNSALDATQRLQLALAAARQAAEYLKIQQQRYLNGLAGQTEVLLAQTRNADAQRAIHNARYDYAQAYWQLRHACGEL